MKALVTGGSGFIASHLSELLLSNGWEVVSVDNTDNEANVFPLLDKRGFEHFRLDVNDLEPLIRVSKGCDTVFHLAANSDIRESGENLETDFLNTFMTTKTSLECMRANGIKKMFFPSTSAVYGDRGTEPLREGDGDLKPISYYGAYKLASESLISAYSHMNSFSALIFRFPNVVGPRLTHGVLFDFMNKLRKNPKALEILGDGEQDKQYIHVHDLVEGIVSFMENLGEGVETYNISTDSSITVTEIADIVCDAMGVSPEYSYTGGRAGWAGDVPVFRYDISKAKAAGWRYRYDSRTAVRKAAEENIGGWW